MSQILKIRKNSQLGRKKVVKERRNKGEEESLNSYRWIIWNGHDYRIVSKISI